MSKTKSRIYFSVSNSLPLCFKTYDQFMADIHRVSRHNRQYSNSQIPCLFGQAIDLQRLYNEVASRGGHKEVTRERLWSEVYYSLGLPGGCVDAGHGLRTIYQRYLEQFERNQRMASKSIFMSEENEYPSIQLDSDYQEAENPKICKSGPMRVDNDELPNHLRESWNLSIDLADQTEYKYLEKSLMCELPNEIEFALNTILLMSSQPHNISLHRNPKLLDLLLLSVGISGTGKAIMFQNWFLESNFPSADSDRLSYPQFSRFWQSSVVCESGRIFLTPHAFSFDYCEDASEANSPSCLTEIQDMIYGDDNSFRVHLVATVLRNLTVDDALSALVICRNPQALRFIFLCVYAKHSCLHQLGLEILSSLHFPVLGFLVHALRILLPNLLISSDRIDRIRGLQIIKNLCTAPFFETSCDRATLSEHVKLTEPTCIQTDRNVAFLASLPSSTFSSITGTLCLRDLHLAVLAVDTIHSLTCLGPLLCDRLLQHEYSKPSFNKLGKYPNQPRGLLSLLVALLNLEAQAMGSESLIRVRVMQAIGTSSINIKPPGSKPSANSFITKPTPSAAIIPSSFNVVPSATTPNFEILPTNLGVRQSTHSQAPSTLVVNSVINNVMVSSDEEKIVLAGSADYVQAKSSTLYSTVYTNPPSSLVQVSSSVSPIRVPKRDLLVRNCSQIQPLNKINIPIREVSAVARPVTVAHSINSATNTISGLTAALSTPMHNEIGKSKFGICSNSITKAPNSNSVTAINCSGDEKRNTNLDPFKFSSNSENIPTASDPREFMFEWLRSNYALHNHSSIPRVQIYSEYQKAHQQKFGNVGVVSPVDFHSRIKSIFPGVGQVKVQVPGGSVEIHYNNLKHVNSPEPESQQGVNHIMASVLSPTKTEGLESYVSKMKSRKRSIISFDQNCTSPKVNTKDGDIYQSPKNVKLATHCETNGHLESCGLTNGIIVQPLNGLSREVTDLIKLNSSIPGESASTKSDSATTTPLDGNSSLTKSVATSLKQAAVVSFPDSRIMILPVFTAFSLGQNLQHTENGVKDTSGLSTTHNTTGSSLKEFSSTNLLLPTSRQENVFHNSKVTECDEDSVMNFNRNVTSIFSSSTCKTPNSSLQSRSRDNAANIIDEKLKCVCEWGDCGQSFDDSNELWNHFRTLHYESVRDLGQVKCIWGKCVEEITEPDTLLNHLAVIHCGGSLLTSKSIQVVVNGLSVSNVNHNTYKTHSSDEMLSNSLNIVTSSCVSATQIFRPSLYDSPIELSDECRRALAGGIPNPPFAPTPVHEGPVTKHLRLTAALTLRNLLQHSELARRYVSSWETILCELAYSNLESSPTIFECLTILWSSVASDRQITKILL